MNRAQRRAAAKAPTLVSKTVNINYGHNGEHVLLQFSQKVDLINLTPEQADAAVKCITEATALLRAHKTQQAIANAGKPQ